MTEDINPKLVSIESVLWSPYGRNGSPTAHWKVILGCNDYNGNRVIEMTFHIEKKDFRDDQVLNVARNYAARWFITLAEATKEWPMTEEQWEATKNKPPVSKTSAPVVEASS